MNVLHILKSDFGARHTMGIRSYHIKNNSDFAISVACRRNASDLKSNIYEPIKLFYFMSRGIQFLRMLWKPFDKLKKIELMFFNMFCKKYILKHDVIHFFQYSQLLFDFAAANKKFIIMEGFTYPKEVENLESKGVQLDAPGFKMSTEEAYCYQNANLIISPSKWVTYSISNNQVKTPVKEVLYGVDQHVMNFKFEEKKKIKVCFAAGIKRTKGVIDLLEAWSLLSEDLHADLELHLYGRMYNDAKPDFEKLKSHNVFFHGFESDVQKIYGDKDIYILPSFFEGSSKTILEALSFGLAVITTFNSGSPVEHEVTGLLVDVNSSEQLKQALTRLLSDRVLFKQLSESGYKLSKELTWSKYAKKVNEVYEGCI